ncbi:MAG: hypothetical protein ACR2MT_11630 [Aurantibacter sp.]
MKLLQAIFFASIFLIYAPSKAQTGEQNDTVAEGNMVFTADEERYITQWFQGFVEEMQLSEEVATAYERITTDYSSRMEALGTEEKAATKSQIIEQFNDLMEQQHHDIKEILTTEQYDIYYDTMSKLVWSVNRRLNQL